MNIELREKTIQNPINEEPKEKGNLYQSGINLLFCFMGLQLSYLTWGVVQEKIMTSDYSFGKFPSVTVRYIIIYLYMSCNVLVSVYNMRLESRTS